MGFLAKEIIWYVDNWNPYTFLCTDAFSQLIYRCKKKLSRSFDPLKLLHSSLLRTFGFIAIFLDNHLQMYLQYNFLGHEKAFLSKVSFCCITIFFYFCYYQDFVFLPFSVRSWHLWFFVIRKLKTSKTFTWKTFLVSSFRL